MMMPSIFKENLFNDWMGFPFADIDSKLYGRNTQSIMRTDIKEQDNSYEVAIDLPGFKKEDVMAELKDGYLTISASKELDNDKKDEDGRYIRRERYVGNMSRSFYVGDDITEHDIHAKFEDGILRLDIPKKEVRNQVEEKRYVTIEG